MKLYLNIYVFLQLSYFTYNQSTLKYYDVVKRVTNLIYLDGHNLITNLLRKVK